MGDFRVGMGKGDLVGLVKGGWVHLGNVRIMLSRVVLSHSQG